MGRIGAAIAAAIALFGAIASIGPLSSSGVDTSAMQTVVASSAVLAGLILIVPWQRMPRWTFAMPLVLMTLSIGALAEAADTAGSTMLVLMAFVVVLAAYYLPRPLAIATPFSDSLRPFETGFRFTLSSKSTKDDSMSR